MSSEKVIKNNRLLSKNWLGNYSIVLVLIVLGLVLSLSTRTFLTADNLVNVFRQVSINGVLAVGMTLVILTGGIDLSVGSIVAFSGIIAAGFLKNLGINNLEAIILAVVIGTAVGAINGYFVGYWHAAPFVVTLAMMSVARGAVYVYSDGQPINPLPDSFSNIGSGDLFHIPYLVILLILVFAVGYLILKYFRIGRHIFAVGGNENAAMVSGINTKKVKLFVYAASGFCCGIAAIMLTARVSSGQPTAGSGYELDAIAATVIGGTSLSGGRGRLWGTILGAFLLCIVSNGIDLLNIPSYYQQIVKGIIILVAILVDSKNNR